VTLRVMLGGSSNARNDWVLPIVFFAGRGAFVGLMLAIAGWNRRTVAHVRIIRTPAGEAPEAIRRAWVGVKLPLRRGETHPRLHQSVGMLSHRAPETTMGYATDSRAAVKALACHAPEAAAWWREHAPPLDGAGISVFFPWDVCARLGSGAGGSANLGSPCVREGRERGRRNLRTATWVGVLSLGENGIGGLWLGEGPDWEDYVGNKEVGGGSVTRRVEEGR
jgi:hypothetical protein